MAAPQVGHLDLAKMIFGYLENYPKRGCENNPLTLNIAVDYERIQMKYDFGNQYVYFSEEIDDQFPKPLLDEFYIHMFVDTDHRHENFTGRYITGLFSVL